jgi:hypothetical protein
MAILRGVLVALCAALCGGVLACSGLSAHRGAVGVPAPSGNSKTPGVAPYQEKATGGDLAMQTAPVRRQMD